MIVPSFNLIAASVNCFAIEPISKTVSLVTGIK